MKMKREHLERLRKEVEKLDQNFHRSRYANAGLSDTRYRWDLLYACNLSQWISDTLYSYLDDTHIDTALRALIKPLDAERAAICA